MRALRILLGTCFVSWTILPGTGCSDAEMSDTSADSESGGSSTSTTKDEGRGGVENDGAGAASLGGVGASTGGGNASSGSGGGRGIIETVSCESPFEDPNDHSSGLPLLQSNPDAGLVLFVDFDGGNYGGTEALGAYYTGGTEERQNIVNSFNYLVQYFAMFDLSITTDASKIGPSSSAKAWGWLVVSPDISGGSGKYGGIGTFTDAAKAKCGASTMTSSDRSRRIAHEFGHNLDLYHNGLYESGVFCKFEDCAGWDGQYGAIMGGGGEGVRNGWGLALFDDERGGSDSPTNLQDSMAKIRTVVRDLGGSSLNDGWAIDDHPEETAAPLCGDRPGELYRIGVLETPDDIDVFEFSWAGGDIDLSWSAPGVSAALVELSVMQGTSKIEGEQLTSLPAGNYKLEVTSQGAYGSIGYYEVSVR